MQSLVSVILLVAAFLPLYATAQQPEANDKEDADEAVEEITVTGSRLVRRDYTASSPIATVDLATFQFAGLGTLEATLNRMPQVTPDFDRTSNNPGNGTARINLRGMGSNRTLVMLNGRRIAPSGIGSSVDANNIPNGIVERVEIITGGASTVYGSDAIAGVVNVITKKNYDGFGIDLSAYTTEEGDAETYDVNVSFGHNFANGRGNISLFGGFLDRHESFASSREFTAVPLFDTWEGEVRPSGSFRVPEGLVAYPTGLPFPNNFEQVIFDANGNPRPFVIPDDLYNYAPVNYLQTPLERTSAGAFFTYDIGRGIDAYAELSFTNKKPKQNLAPTPSGGFFYINYDSPVLTPATSQLFQDNLIPLGGTIVGGFYGRRLLELGPRIREQEEDYLRAVVGLKGELFGSWDFDFWVTYTKGEEQFDWLNGASRARLQQGLLIDPASGQCFDPSGGCVPIDIFGPNRISPEGIEFIRLPPMVNVTDRTQRLASIFVRGDLFDTWAGPIKTAFGLEWRDDEGSFEADEYLFTGDALGLGGAAPVNGSETVTEAYVEALIPIAEMSAIGQYFGLEVGARYSDYENAGSVSSMKSGLEWQINDTLKIRAMYQESVRAPDLREAFEIFRVEDGTWVGFQPLEDPCSASADPIGAGNVDACVATGIPESQLGIFEAQVQFPMQYIEGGNPGVRPEQAETRTIGAVIVPEIWPGWQFSVDYFDLQVEDEIGYLDNSIACFDPLNSTRLFCERIRRDPVSYNVIEIDNRITNTGVLRTRGVDTAFRFATDLPDYLALFGSADLVINSTWTRMLQNSYRATPFGYEFECSGYFGWPCNGIKWGDTFPRDRVLTTFNYASGDLNLFLSWQWISSSDNAGPQGAEFFGWPEPILTIVETGIKNYLDLGIGYQVTDNIVARLTISNLTDTTPPQMADATYSNNTDTALYDVFGRSYTLRLSMQY